MKKFTFFLLAAALTLGFSPVQAKKGKANPCMKEAHQAFKTSRTACKAKIERKEKRTCMKEAGKVFRDARKACKANKG